MNQRLTTKLTFCVLLGLSVLGAGLARAAVAPDARVREYDILRAFPAGRLASLSSGDYPDEKGFTGTNRVNGRWLEAGPQRGSCRGVIAAVVADDLAKADDAWRGIDVAFSHQRPDGGFEADMRPNGKSAKAQGPATETAFFFLQELGRMILVIRESPHEAHFHDRIAKLEPKIRKACAFITAGYDTIIANSSKAVNRIVLAAKAFGTCGLVLQDDSLIATSRKLIKHALTLRDAEGVFIENGGRDSSYNVVSVFYGQILALHLDIPEFEAALPAAVKWELTRIKENGEVEVAGNSRTGVGKETSYSGQPKNVNYNEVIFALTLYGMVHHDQAALNAADRVFRYSQRPKPDGK